MTISHTRHSFDYEELDDGRIALGKCNECDVTAKDDLLQRGWQLDETPDEVPADVQ